MTSRISVLTHNHIFRLLLPIPFLFFSGITLACKHAVLPVFKGDFEISFADRFVFHFVHLLHDPGHMRMTKE